MKRFYYLDYLRIYATIAVITIHVSATAVRANPFETGLSGWLSGNFFESLARASVPIFIMISGALLLNDNRSLPYSQFLKKRISKIAIPLLLWSIIYYLAGSFSNEYDYSTKNFIYKLLTDDIIYHLWFMYTIIGLYLITPLVKILMQHSSKRDVEYFLGLWIFASVLLKFMVYLVGFSIKIELFFVTNFVGYFVLGYYLLKYQFSKKNILYSQILLILGLLGTFFLTYYGTIKNQGVLEQYWYEYHSITVLLTSVGLFTLFKDILFKSKQDINAFLNWFSQASFGIFLVHVLVLNYLLAAVFDKINIQFHSIIAIPLNVIIILIVSSMITYIIRKIPVLRKMVP
ncbi:acyltransferase [Paenisporosarcina sp. TG-14]|uniref:acyltransferase n=1 Tax=Paenisporosarcina sp. TG-14 TaxID=1231057 RepID=UPI0002E85559|nr:acyltransferase family protein [Paenisporosarcina sp. TG-14]